MPAEPPVSDPEPLMTSHKGRPLLVRAAGVAACLAVVLVAGHGPGPSPAVAQEAASAIQDVTLQDVTLSLGGTILTAPRVTVSGTRLTREDLLALLKVGGESVAARLGRLDATSIVISELRSESRVKGGRQAVTYRDVVARDVRAGRIADLTASGATIVVDGDGPHGSGSYGRLQATDLDLTALARLYGEPGDAKSAMLRVYGAFSAADVAYLGKDGATVTIARIAGKDLGGRQIPATWTGALQAVSGLDVTKADPVQSDPAARSRMMGLIGDLAEGVSIGSLEASGIRVTQAKGADPVSFGIGTMRYGAAGASLEDIAFSGGGAGGKLGRLSLTGFSLAPTIAALRKLSAAATEPSDDDLRRLTPVIGTVALKDLSLDLPAEIQPPARDSQAAPRGSQAAPRDPLAPAPRGPTHIGLRDGAMSFGPPRDGVPTDGRATLSGLTLPASAVAGVPGLGSLKAYGYGDLDLDLTADTAWNEGAKELSVREVSVTGKDMGSLRIKGILGGIGPEVFDPDAGVSAFAMLSATAKAFDLTIANNGLFERFIAAQSKVLSLKPEELTQEYVTASVVGVPAILGNSAGAKAIGAAMGQFVAKPGTLSVSAKAKNAAGIGVMEFSAAPTPAAVLERLDVNAKAN